MHVGARSTLGTEVDCACRTEIMIFCTGAYFPRSTDQIGLKYRSPLVMFNCNLPERNGSTRRGHKGNTSNS